MSSNAEAFEAITEQIPPTLSFSINFAGIGVSLINKKLVEVVYLSVTSLLFEYTASPVAQAVNLSFGTLQIDNQLHDAIFPVILQPTPMPKGPNGVSSLPTVQVSVIWLNDQGWRDYILYKTLPSDSRVLHRTWCFLCEVHVDFATSVDYRSG